MLLHLLPTLLCKLHPDAQPPNATTAAPLQLLAALLSSQAASLTAVVACDIAPTVAMLLSGPQPDGVPHCRLP